MHDGGRQESAEGHDPGSSCHVLHAGLPRGRRRRLVSPGRGGRAPDGRRVLQVLLPALLTLCAASSAARGVSNRAEAGETPGTVAPAVAGGPVLIEDHFVETTADSSGSIDVSVVDGQGFDPGAHGQRITEVFLANTNRARLVQVGGWGSYSLSGRTVSSGNLAGYIRHALERGGGIFWTSTDSSPLYWPRTVQQWFVENGRAFHKDARAVAAWMQGQNTLFVSSLENPTVESDGLPVYCDDFDPDGGWIPLCGALDDYIAHSGVALGKTVFVGAIGGGDVAGAGIRAEGVFAPHTIYVESPDGSTSQATPVLAAYATNLAFSNPSWGAAKLKKELMGLAVTEVVDHFDGAVDSRGTIVSERRAIKAIRPAFAPKGDRPASSCRPDAETLCLQDSRYQVRAEWWTRDGMTGTARTAEERTSDSGLFWFFDRDNWEMLIKVLDGCSINGHVWVFGASQTDLGYRVTVTDTVAGIVRQYRNEAGLPAPAIADATAFPESCRR